MGMKMGMNFMNSKKLTNIKQPTVQRRTVQTPSVSRGAGVQMAMIVPSSGPGCGSCGRH